MRRRNNLGHRQSSGFSLVELAVVVAIVAFLMGGLMYTLSAQTEQRSFEETRRRLEYARDLILAFAIVNGRLPCPARSASTASPATVAGDEVVTTATGCVGDGVTDNYGGASGGVTLGLLPARSIGFQPVDASGFAVDAWGNRLRYAVARLTTPSASCPTPHFVNATNLKANGVSCQPNDLLICKSASGITSSSCGGASNQIMTQSLVVAIIFSTGKNGAGAAGGIDEAANLNGGGNVDPIFVYHAPTPSTAANGAFDDQFVWITTGELYGKLIAAGQLP
jgi:prepilin-type N-terminal cleavage/methylation domain-containing protein